MESELWDTWKGLNLRLGVLDGLRYLSRHYQIVIFSRESTNDSYSQEKGGRDTTPGEQTKVIKHLLQTNKEIRLDGLYRSIKPHREQNMYDDYT